MKRTVVKAVGYVLRSSYYDVNPQWRFLKSGRRVLLINIDTVLNNMSVPASKQMVGRVLVKVFKMKRVYIREGGKQRVWYFR